MDAPVLIAPYSPAWPQSFAKERDLLATVLAPWLAGPIEHVGSTAIPGLAAKPVIDIMAAVRDLESSRPALERLAEIGYCYAPYRPDVEHWLCKPGPALRTHHLHLVPYRSALWKERIGFRDLLLGDSVLAEEYAALKHRLAGIYRNERELYTDAKGPFIERALRECRVVVEEYSPRWPAMFADEKRALVASFAPDAVDVQHVGSTSVPGLAAKPVIDIMVGAPSLSLIERHIGDVEAMGYRYVPEFERTLPMRRYFVKPRRGEHAFHVHAVERGSDFWNDELAFREALRGSEPLANEYAQLKRRLAAEFGSDREGYTDAKAPFIRSVLAS